MPVAGDLRTMALTDLLQWAASTRRNGVLELERRGRTYRIELRDGDVTACWTDDPGARLGQFLLGRGRITEQQLREALDYQETTGRTLGRALLELGFFDEPELKKLIVQKAEETMQGLFEWDDAGFRFDRGAVLNASQIEVRTSVEGLLLKVAQRQDELQRIREAFSSSSVVLERTAVTPPEELLAHAGTQRIYAAVDGARSIAELLLHIRSAEFPVLKLLHKMREMGLVRVKSAGGAAPAGARTLLDPEPETEPATATVPAEPEAPRDAHAGQEALADIEVARRLLERGEHGQALERLQASLGAHPGNECLRAMIVEAETACIAGLRRSVKSNSIPVVLELEPADAPLNAEESFLLSVIDGDSDVRALTWVSPLREVDLLRALQRMAERGLIELRPRR